MTALLGGIGVVVAFAASMVGALTLVLGVVRRRAVLVATGFRFVPVLLVGAIVAFASMEVALVRHDFSVAYVQRNNARETPLLYTIAGLWASLEGSILLWGFVLAVYIALVTRHFRARQGEELVAWATATLLAISAFFWLLMLSPANPFVRLATVASNGRGPNPLLQNHPLMAIHPPILYAGYVGMSVPFAFAVAALVTGRLGEGWLLEVRRWTLASWGFLTVGIGLGAWWSYEVLGWGGYWGWDAVENASLLPWLTATAFIHSVLVQERRAMLRVWNLSLVCATFSLTILGTFLTRSGVISSVHAFSNSTIGPWLISFLAVTIGLSIGLIAWRGDRLRSVGSIDAPVSREGAFLANNVLFGGFAFVVLLGTVFPLAVEAWNSNRLSVGAPYFDTMARPLGLVMLFLMAIAPLLPWRKAAGEVLARRVRWPMAAGVATTVLAVLLGARGTATLLAYFFGMFAAGSALRQLGLAISGTRARRAPLARAFVGRSNGGMVVHLGIIVMALAIATSRSYATNTQLALLVGETRVFQGHDVTLVGLRSDAQVAATGEVVMTRQLADVRVDDGRIDTPALTRFDQQGMTIGTPSVRTGLLRDVYVTYIQAPPKEGEKAIIGLYLQPGVVWIWIGLVITGLGTLLAIVPAVRRRPAPYRAGQA